MCFKKSKKKVEEPLDNLEADQNEINDKTRLAYDALRGKQLAYDNLMWQTPLLCITAQSFLFSVSLTSTNSSNSKIISSLLAAIIGFAAIQLMSKHRYHEKYSSKRLELLEDNNKLIKIHKRPPRSKYLINRISSFWLWITSLTFLTIFGLIAFFYFFNKVFL